jgi:hypothetical protein
VSQFLQVSQRVRELRRTQIFLPIAKCMCENTALLAGEDLALRTAVITPGAFDRELNMSLFVHSYIYDIDTKKPIDAIHSGNDRERIEGFLSNISYIDRECMMWAFHKSSYGVIDKDRKVTCRNADCKQVTPWDIYPDDVVHEDTFMPWDKPLSFKEYTEKISISYDDIIFEFNAHIPALMHFNTVMSSMSMEKVQLNFEKLDSAFSRTESLVLHTKSIRLVSKSNMFPTVETSDLKEMLIFVENDLPQDVMDKFFEEYDTVFEKYFPKFYFNVTCPHCQNKFKLNFNLTNEFTRKLFQSMNKRAEDSDTLKEISTTSEEIQQDNPEPEQPSGATTSFIKSVGEQAEV